MNYHYLIPSLEENTATKLTILMFTEELKRTMYVFQTRQIERTICSATEKKILKLNIPVAFKKKIMQYIEPIYVQMEEWTHYHEAFLHSERRFKSEIYSNKLCWTGNGVIDRKRTAERLIEDEILDVGERYQLACVYCLEEDILKLWNKLPVSYQEQLRDKIYQQYEQLDLTSVWTLHINGMESVLDYMFEEQPRLSFYQHALKSATRYGNEVAIEYFLQKLDPKLRDESLLNCVRLFRDAPFEFDFLHISVPDDYYDGAIRCLFLQMSESQQMMILRGHSRDILHSLLRWPWSHFFVPIVERVADFLTEDYYDYLLDHTAFLSRKSRRTSEYQKIFKDLWQLTPRTSKRHIYSKGLLLFRLILFEDREIFAIMFSNSSPNERAEAIFGYQGKEICEGLILRKKWAKLRFFVEHCITSVELMKQFKAELTHHIKNSFLMEKIKNDGLKEFHELLDDIVNGWMRIEAERALMV